MRCAECEAEAVVLGEEGMHVCESCGLVQPGGVVFSRTEYKPSFVAPGPAKILRKRSVTSRDRWVARIRQYAQLAGLKDRISKKAIEIYDSATGSADWKTRKSEYQLGVLVACLYHACNCFSAHRSPQELCGFVGVDPKSARRMVKVTQRAADEVRESAPTSRADVTKQMLPRCACRLPGLRGKLNAVVRAAREVYLIVRSKIDNHRPDTIAAGLLSVAVARCQAETSNDEISAACLVAPNTVRSMAVRIQDALRS